MSSYDDVSYHTTPTPPHAWAHERRGSATPSGASRHDADRRETNIIGAVLATIGLVTAVLCALAYGDVISLQSRFTVPGILLAIGGTAVIAGAIGLALGRRRR